MLKPRIDKGYAKREKPVREGNDPAHLDLVRQLPCVCCGADAAPSEAHHLLRVKANTRGTALKNADKWAVPLCTIAWSRSKPGCHERLHHNGNEEVFLMLHDIDGRAVARELWKHTGDLDAMLRVIDRARSGAALKRGVG